ncbi:MAG: tRNA (adenosine(37)-N6)-threonylcarbamoyltransferase complex ATPase subunit type 1 TsaE [Brumimicrobium sp.]
MKYCAKKESDLIHISTKFLEDVEGYNIFAFRGEMGVGKTTFISYLARAMGITDKVSSPTYAYINEYESPFYGTVYHFDLYRITDENEAYDIGIEEYLYGDARVFLEWAENIDNLLPDNCVWVTITKDDDGIRTIEVEL